MFGLSLDRGLVIEGAAWVDEVLRVEDPAAIIALVSARLWVVAVGAFAFDETVGEKAFVAEAVELGYLLAVDEPVLLDFEVKLADELFVDSALGSSVIVEFYLESFEKVDDESVVLVGQLAGWNSEFDGLYLDRSAVLVASTDHYDVFTV